MTLVQVSSGKVAFCRVDSKIGIAIVLTKPKSWWQLPKGIVESSESPDVTAVREVREEAGIETHLLARLERRP